MNPRGYALVLTGATGGLGSAFARAVATSCRAMALVARDAGRLDELRAELAARHPQLGVIVVDADLTDPAARRRVRDVAAALPGGPNLLVNAAGASRFASFESQTEEEVERQFAVNLFAPMHLTRQLLPLLRAAPRAQVVNVGSIFGHLGYPGFTAYCAGKFALRGFSQSLRRELADTTVAVRHFAPRAIRTPLNSPAVDAMNAELGTAVDSAGHVAAALVGFIDGNAWEQKLGLAERFYVLMNQIFPAAIDRAIRGQLPVIRRHLGPSRMPALSKEE